MTTELLDDYLRLQKRVAQCEKDFRRAEGSLAATRQRLREEFGCETSTEVERLLKESQMRIASASSRLQSLMDDFLSEYQDRLR